MRTLTFLCLTQRNNKIRSRKKSEKFDCFLFCEFKKKLEENATKFSLIWRNTVQFESKKKK